MTADPHPGPRPYVAPRSWIRYDQSAIFEALVRARATVLALREMPLQRPWVEHLQLMELKREVAGTSRIEGAVLTERELDQALAESAEQLATRSQRQVAAALATYRWIATIPDDRPIDVDLILDVHRKLVTGADDDHCPPGRLRSADENVTYGAPRHRGVQGGSKCLAALQGLVDAIAREFQGHDLLVQAIATHFHFAAMHPFLDGNGRTARALEALFLQRAGLRDHVFVSVSNFYHEEKTRYLAALAAVDRPDYDLTPFLAFALEGVASQAYRVLLSIRIEVARELYRNTMHRFFGRLKSSRKRVLARRQLAILEFLLKRDGWVSSAELAELAIAEYQGLARGVLAFRRDAESLMSLGAVEHRRDAAGQVEVRARLDWPSRMDESGFLAAVKQLTMAKSSFEW